MTTKERMHYQMAIDTLTSIATKCAIESAECQYNGNEKDSNFKYGAACADNGE